MTTAIITGASKGIGKAIAEEFAKEGYDLALISRNYYDVERVSQELSSEYSGTYVPFQADISNELEIPLTFSAINKQFGSIEVLVNNAGINSRKSLDTKNINSWFHNFKENLEGFDSELATNLRGTYICSYIAAGYMLRKGSGNIINISSIKAKEPTSSLGYGASKAGIIKLTKDFAKALAPKIRVNCIAPGFIKTGMTLELSEEKQEAYKKLIPQQRFGNVIEIAKTAVFLASDESSYITGTTINVNGGYLM
jgi:3-oxoacyl-[acyl-carrier protein] reductase